MPRRANEDGLFFQRRNAAEKRIVESVVGQPDVKTLERAAEVLGLDRTYLASLVRKYGIDVPWHHRRSERTA